MCMACSQMFSSIHWSDSQKTDSNGFTDQRRLIKTRLTKVKYTNYVLSYYGLKVDSQRGGTYFVSDRKGRSLLCKDFGEVWQKAQKLSGRMVDPLDPALIDYLNSRLETA